MKPIRENQTWLTPRVRRTLRWSVTCRGGERPRERLRELGASYLSNAELIAILLRTGTRGESVLSLATRLLTRFAGMAGMARVSYGELCSLKGISDAKACQLLAALELGRRLVSMNPEDRNIVRTPQDVANLLAAEMGYLQQEHLRVILLSTKKEVRGIHEVYIGNVNASIIRVSEVLRPAIRENCPSIIVVHNHPFLACMDRTHGGRVFGDMVDTFEYVRHRA